MKRRLLTFAACFALHWPAEADITASDVVQGSWKLMRGTSNVVTGLPDVPTCVSEAKKDSEARKRSASYSCVRSDAFSVTWSTFVCPAQPAAIVQTNQCPAGTTGSWSQTQNYVSAPSPTCWALSGSWTPAAAPAGACAPVQATWTKLVSENTAFNVPANTQMRYGAQTTWIYRTVSGSGTCSNDFFGIDPLPGVMKQCDVGGTPPPPPVTGSATLSWVAPTTNADGTPLTDLAGYIVQYGLNALAPDQTVSVGLVNTAAIQNLGVGVWYFRVVAVDTSGNQSVPSVQVSKEIK